MSVSMKSIGGLSVQTKIAALCGIFVIPIVALFYIFVNNKNETVAFSAKEVDGQRYNNAVVAALTTATRYRMSGQDALVGKLEQDLQAVAKMEAAYGQAMKTSKHYADMQKAWADFKAQPGKHAGDIFAAIDGVNARVGDQSNLILDPDLDTYYEMDLVLLKEPAILDQLSQLIELGKKVNGQGRMSRDERTQFIVIKGLISSLLDGVDYDLKVATENESTYGRTVPIKARLEGPVKLQRASVTDLLSYVEKHFVEGDPNHIFGGGVERAGLAAVDKLEAIYKLAAQSLIEGCDARADMHSRNRNFNITWTLLVTLGALLLAGYIAMSLRPIKQIAGMLQEIAEGEGDLTRRLPVASEDEVGETALWFNKFIDQISDIAVKASHLADQVAGTAQVLSTNSQEQEAGATHQSAACEETSRSAQANATAARAIAAHASEMRQTAEQMMVVAQGSREALERTRGGMEEIVEQNSLISTRVQSLYEQSQAIINIVDIIDSVTDRLDLLALNAGLEGSRAGEAGKGFSLVAQEMRRLAENVSESTTEIKNTIQEIHRFTKAALDASAAGEKITKAGASEMDKMAGSIEEIFGLVERTTGGAREITTSTQQQLSSIENMVQSLNQMNVVTTQGVAACKQVTTSAGDLNKIAGNLREVVSIFKVGSGNGHGNGHG